MSKLKAQTDAQRPAHATMTWPELKLPEADPRFGMTGAHQEALQSWYSSVQGEVNTRLSAMSDEIETLKTQLNSKG